MYGLERVLRTDRHRDRLGIYRVFVPGLFVRPLGLSGRLLRNQGISFSSLKEYMRNIWVSQGAATLLCCRTPIFIRTD